MSVHTFRFANETGDDVVARYTIDDDQDPGHTSTAIAAGTQRVGTTGRLADWTDRGVVEVTEGMVIRDAIGYFVLNGGALINCHALGYPTSHSHYRERGLTSKGGLLIGCEINAPHYGKGLFLEEGYTLAVGCANVHGTDTVYAIGGTADLVGCLFRPSDTGIVPASYTWDVHRGTQAHCDGVQLAPHHDTGDSAEWVRTHGCAFVLPDDLPESQCVLVGVGSLGGLDGGPDVYRSHGDHFQGSSYMVNTKAEVRDIAGLCTVTAPAAVAGSFAQRDYPDARGPVVEPTLLERDGFLGSDAINWLGIDDLPVPVNATIRETVPPNDPTAPHASGAPRIICNPFDGPDSPARFVIDERAEKVVVPDPIRVVEVASTSELQAALNVSQPGDHIRVGPGVTINGDLNIIGRIGTEENPIVVESLHGWWDQSANAPVITGQGFDIFYSAHVVIRYLHLDTIFNTSSSSETGINVIGKRHNADGPIPGQDPGTNITVHCCWLRKTEGSAIAFRGVAGQQDPGPTNDNLTNVRVVACLIEEASTGSEFTVGYNECVMAANGVANVLVSDSIVRRGYADRGREGLDFKDGVSGGKWLRCIVSHLHQRGFYIDGGEGPGHSTPPMVEDIEMAYCLFVGGRNDPINNGGSALNINTEGWGNIRNVDVHHNLLCETGTRSNGQPYHAIMVWKVTDSGANEGGDQSTIFEGLKFRFNTIWRCDGNGINQQHPDVDDTIIEGNVIVECDGPHDILDVAGTPSPKNLARNTNGVTYAANPPALVDLDPTGTLGALLTGSPAIDPADPITDRPAELRNDYYGTERVAPWSYGAVQHV